MSAYNFYNPQRFSSYKKRSYTPHIQTKHVTDVEIKSFIVSILKGIGLSDNNISNITDNEGMIIFSKAFTHPSYDSHNNYEYLEFRGDPVVNMTITQYLQQRFPRIISIKWITRIKHNLVGKKELAKLSERQGFLKYIRYGQHILNIIRSENKYTDEDYLSMLEDVFEAFFGAIIIVCGQKYRNGIGYSIAYAIMRKMLDNIKISLKWTDVFDSKSRLKEFYDSLVWPFQKSLITREKDNGGFYSFMVGYFDRRNNKPIEMIDNTNIDFVNRVVLGKAEGINAEVAENKVANIVFNTLFKKYNLRPKRQDPYTAKEQSENLPVPKIPFEFKNYMVNIFKYAGVKKSSIKEFTSSEYLFDYWLCFIDPSYNSISNNRMYKMLGITTIDLSVIEYIGKKFSHIRSEDWLTRIKHSVVSKQIFLKLAIKLKFGKYIKYGKFVKEHIEKHGTTLIDNKIYIQLLKGTFKALLGSIVHIIDKKREIGVGYTVASRIISYFLEGENISSEYKDIYDAKTRLKELYDTLGWNFKRDFVENRTESGFTIMVYGYPSGNRKRYIQNKVLLATVSGSDKKVASQQAAQNALDKLEKYYGIREVKTFAR